MKPLFILMFTISTCIPDVWSQSVARSTVGASGSSQIVISNNKSYFVSQSVGQVGVIGTLSVSGHTILQGFQQPPFLFKIGQAQKGSDLKAIIYPNPFQQMVHIAFTDEIENDVSVIMHDISGQIILNETYEASQLITLQLTHMPTGDYIINVVADKKHLTTSLIKY